MRFRDMLFEVYLALSANKMRSFLTILGIVIGISSVITMTSLVGGLGNSMTSSLGLDQARIINIMPMAEADSDDFEELAELMDDDYEQIIVTKTSSASLDAEGKSAMGRTVVGTPSTYADTMGLKIEEGGFYSAQDDAQARRVIVVGRGIVKELFGSEDAEALGRQMSIGSETLTILGVLEGGGSSADYQSVYMPLTTMEQRLPDLVGTLSGYGIIAEDSTTDITTLTENTQQNFARILGSSDPSSDVFVYSMEQLIEQLSMIMSGFSMLLGAIASISLFVGGIGIMNMMLTNVTERIREIGLRKALGARSRDIVRQFLAEAIILCIIGGIIGIVFGYIGSWTLAGIVNLLSPDLGLAPDVSVQAVLAATGVSALIGIVFGFYPARRAAKLDPIEALRYQ